MTYRLIQSQYGGGATEILLLIAAIVLAYYLFVQLNCPKKKKITEKYGHNYGINSQSSSASYESTATDAINAKTRPAVDLKAPGVPYLPFPPNLDFGSKSSSKPRPGYLSSYTSSDNRQGSPKKYDSKISLTTESSVASKVSSVSSVASKVSSVSSKSSGSSKSSSSSASPVSSPVASPVASPQSPTASSVQSPARPVSAPVVPKAVVPKAVVPKAVAPKMIIASKVPAKDGKKIEKFTDVNNLYSINDGYDLKVPISNSVCSQKCCGYYWNEKESNMFKKNDPVKWEDVGVGRKYRTSNVTCMGDGVAPPGCRCYTSKQNELLATRGGNGSKHY